MTKIMDIREEQRNSQQLGNINSIEDNNICSAYRESGSTKGYQPP
jgi:hypothetical protein